MKLDFDEITRITGVPRPELENRYNNWEEKGKRNGSRNIDLKLIAALSGVSKSSVSNFINKKRGTISAEKSLIIEKLMSHLEYTPSNAARKLGSRLKMSIGYIAPISNGRSTEYYIDILRGMKKEAGKFGYSIDIYDINSEENENANFSELPFMGMVDGIIVVSSVVTAEELKPLYKNNIPVFHINPRIEETRPPFIGSAYSETAPFSQLLDHLFIEHRYRNPMLLSVDINDYSQREEKYNLFIECMAQNGMEFDEEKNVVFLESYSLSEGLRAYETACIKNPDIDVFVCLSDTVAIPVIRALEKGGKNAAVTGYADFEIARIFDLTTIDQNIELLGVMAFQKLYYAMKYIQQNGDFPEYSVQRIPVNFIKRKSCACKA